MRGFKAGAKHQFFARSQQATMLLEYSAVQLPDSGNTTASALYPDVPEVATQNAQGNPDLQPLIAIWS